MFKNIELVKLIIYKDHVILRYIIYIVFITILKYPFGNLFYKRIILII